MTDIDRATLKAASEESGVHIETLRSRLKRGMSLDDAVKVESGPYVGVTAASRRTKIPVTTLVSRVNAGKTLDEAVAMGHPDGVCGECKGTGWVGDRIEITCPTCNGTRLSRAIPEDTMRRRVERKDPAPLRPLGKRQSGVAETAKRTGLSPQRVSELMGQGVAPDQIERMRAKQETPRERRERIDAANQSHWRKIARVQAHNASVNWALSFIYLLVGWTDHAASHARQAASYERTATWWADKAIGQWCSVCNKKHPPPMHHRGDMRY